MNAPEKNPYTAAYTMIDTNVSQKGHSVRVKTPQSKAAGAMRLKQPKKSLRNAGRMRPRSPNALRTARME